VTSDVSLPLFLRRLSTDEFSPHPYSGSDRRVVCHTLSSVDDARERLSRPPRALIETRLGTAEGLRALSDVSRTAGWLALSVRYGSTVLGRGPLESRRYYAFGGRIQGSWREW
jgi:hypothetical protein